MAASTTHPVLPTNDEDSTQLVALKKALATHHAVELSTPDGPVPLPSSVRSVLADVVDVLARGQAVTVAPEETKLTTQEAADRLGISRPTLVRLLEQQKIPYTQPGRHRRVELADVLAFQEAEHERRSRILDEIARDDNPDPESASDGFIETR